MKYEQYTNASKNYRWILVVNNVISELFEIKLIFLRSELNVATF